METISTYNQNVRYHLAKEQLDQLFLRWISQENIHLFVNKLIDEVKDPTANILSPPTPIFINKIATPLSPSTKTTSGGIMGTAFGNTPPRSPSGNDKYKTLINPVFEPISNKEEEKDLAARTLTGNELVKAMKKKEKIPQFYFEGGKPLPSEVVEANDAAISAAFSDKREITVEDFTPICEQVFKFPKFLNSLLFIKLDSNKTGKLTREQLEEIWRDDYEKLEVSRRLFNVIKKPSDDYLHTDDFKPILRVLLDSHPGLEFLQATPEFQDRYADTVVMRIFYAIDTNDDGRISYRDLK